MATVNETLCPCCWEHCELRPLHRGGSYQLIDPDGQPHVPVCLYLVRRPATGGAYARTYERRTVAGRRKEAKH